MKITAALLALMLPLMTSIVASAETPLEVCEKWALEEEIPAPDRRDYIDDCIEEMESADVQETPPENINYSGDEPADIFNGMPESDYYDSQ